MNIQLQTQGFDLTDGISAYVQKRLINDLARFDDHVVSVDVFLRDVNGPKGGPDKKALIFVRLGSRLSVKIERTHVDLYAAIALASRQAKRAVRRAVSKQKCIERFALRELRHLTHV